MFALRPDAWENVPTPDAPVSRLTQVCMRVPGAELAVAPDQVASGVRFPRGAPGTTPVTVAARLVDVAGARTPLDVVDYDTVPGGARVCLGRWYAPDVRYRAVELQASAPLTVDALLWRADPRTKLGF